MAKDIVGHYDAPHNDVHQFIEKMLNSALQQKYNTKQNLPFA